MYEFPGRLSVRMFVAFWWPKLFPGINWMPRESVPGRNRLFAIFGRNFRTSFASMHLRSRTDWRRMSRRNDGEFSRRFSVGFRNESGPAGLSAFVEISDNNSGRNFGHWRRYFEHESFSNFVERRSNKIKLVGRHRINF